MFVHLVYPVYLVGLVQPNNQDRPNRRDRPYEQDRLADYFSIRIETFAQLLVKRG